MAAVLQHNLKVRPMRRADLKRVREIETSVYPWPWSDGIFADCIRIGYCCRVAELEGRIVGYAILSVAVGEAHLLNLCVAPESRRAGIGQTLLDTMCLEAVLRQGYRMFLEVRPSNKAAIKLYRANDFHVIGRRPGYYPAQGGREDALVMVRHLDLVDD